MRLSLSHGNICQLFRLALAVDNDDLLHYNHVTRDFSCSQGDTGSLLGNQSSRDLDTTVCTTKFVKLRANIYDTVIMTCCHMSG